MILKESWNIKMRSKQCDRMDNPLCKMSNTTLNTKWDKFSRIEKI